MATVTPFTRFTEEELTTSYNPPMTTEDKIQAAIALGALASQAVWVERRPCLSMPALPIFGAYSQWYPEFPPHAVPFGLVCENIDTWRAHYGEDAFRDIIRSVLERGRPTQHWTWVHHIDAPPRRRSARSHSPAARAA